MQKQEQSWWNSAELEKKFQTELNEVLNYVDQIKVQNSIS